MAQRIAQTLAFTLVLAGGIGLGFALSHTADHASPSAEQQVSIQSAKTGAPPAKSEANTVPQNTGSEPENSSGQRVACKVLQVADGDTIGCDLDKDGKITKPIEEVRLLGIDTPEMHYSRKNKSYGTANPVDEPGAKVASQWMTQLVTNKTVYLEFDERHYDRYGRVLAYVYLNPSDTLSINEQGLRQGYAKLLILGKNRHYEDQFTTAESEAKQAHRGLWTATESAAN